jgi:excisionase family DNA binding protein
MEALLCSKDVARRALGLGSTKTDELISEGVLETVRIGRRRLVKIASVHRLAGITPGQVEDV